MRRLVAFLFSCFIDLLVLSFAAFLVVLDFTFLNESCSLLPFNLQVFSNAIAEKTFWHEGHAAKKRSLLLLQFDGREGVLAKTPVAERCHQHNWAMPADKLYFFVRFRPAQSRSTLWHLEFRQSCNCYFWHKLKTMCEPRQTFNISFGISAYMLYLWLSTLSMCHI